MVTFSRTLDSNTAGSCGKSREIAPRCLRCGWGVPSTAIETSSASTNPANTRSSELFPAPLAPIRAMRCPRRSSTETSSSAGRPGMDEAHSHDPDLAPVLRNGRDVEGARGTAEHGVDVRDLRLLADEIVP